jgi:hypothetical protein
MVPETLTELVPGERVAVLSWVGLPPVESGTSQLPCCVQNSLTVIALSHNQLALHRTKPVVRLEWVRGVREGRRVTSQEIRTPITGLRRRWRWGLGMDLLQSLNSVVQGSHHLHLELEELLRGQWWRHRQRLTSTLVVLLLRVRTGTGAPGVHHLIATNEIFMSKKYCAAAAMKLRKDMTERKEYRFYPQRSNSNFYYLVQAGLGSIYMNKFNY